MHETRDQTPVLPAEPNAGSVSKDIFSMSPDPLRSTTGLVQQTVQIVARFARTI
jgi:hypothetical protein